MVVISQWWVAGILVALFVGLSVAVFLLARWAWRQYEQRLSVLEERMHAMRGSHLPALGERVARCEEKIGLPTPEQLPVVAFPAQPERRPRA